MPEGLDDRLERLAFPSEDHPPASGLAGDGQMLDGIKSVVDAYVRLKNRAKLDEMRMHRHRLRVSLHLHGDETRYNVGPAIRSLDDDLSVIEAGIERL
jgi:hypothetical protein